MHESVHRLHVSSHLSPIHLQLACGAAALAFARHTAAADTGPAPPPVLSSTPQLAAPPPHAERLHSAQQAKLSAWKNSEDVPSSVNGVDSVALDGARARVLAGPMDASDAARDSTSTRDGASNRNSSAYRG